MNDRDFDKPGRVARDPLTEGWRLPMVLERYHKTFPVPAQCRFRHKWCDRDASKSDPAHYVATSRYLPKYRFEECARCGARQVVENYTGGGHAPYDSRWVVYDERPVPTTDVPCSAIPHPTPRLNRVPPTV